MAKNVAVLGAGPGGLITASLLKDAGFNVDIYEKNSSIGGLMSGYYVKGFYIDACLHWLMGTRNNTKINALWRNLDGLNDEVKIIHQDYFVTIIYEGITLHFGKDLLKTREEWLIISPKDKKEIYKFFHLMEIFKDLWIASQSTEDDPTNFKELFKNVVSIYKAMKLNREEYGKRFKHPIFAHAFKYAETGYNNMLFFLLVYGSYASGDSGVPYGGILGMMERVKKALDKKEINFFFNTFIKDIKIEDDKVTGIYVDDVFKPYDYVISCLDLNYTFHDLLKNKYPFKFLDRLNNEIKRNPISSCYNVYLALKDEDLIYDSPTVIHIDPLKIGTKEVDSILVRPYSFDDHFKKDGYTVVSIYIDQDQDDYHFYASLEKEEYQLLKKKYDDEVISRFLKVINNKYELIYLDSFTPIELYHRSLASFGALQAFSLTPKRNWYILKGYIKGLDNFYYASQWNRPIGGSPCALISGNKIAKMIIEKEKK